MIIAIYQINPNRDRKRVAFMSTAFLESYLGGSEIDSSIYDRVFEGEVECEGLEDVFRIFNLNHPEGYKGRSLSVSDVVEVIDDNGDSTFHFCDSFGFKEISFDPDLAEDYKEETIKVVLCEPGKIARIAEVGTICGFCGYNYGSLSQEQLDRYLKQFERPEQLLKVNGKLMSIPYTPDK